MIEHKWKGGVNCKHVIDYLRRSKIYNRVNANRKYLLVKNCDNCYTSGEHGRKNVNIP